MAQSRQPAIAVFCSGAGTNLQAILTSCARGTIPARVALVISDRPGAYALTRARRAGVPAVYLNPAVFPDRAGFERELIARCRAARVRVVCLAGFMRILSPVFVRAFRHRILNIHPALLPAFPGAHAVRDALAWGVKVTGVSVHVVDEHVDRGPIVLQEPVLVRPGDTEAPLLARLHRVEHRLYPQAIRLMLSGRVGVRGRQAVIHSLAAKRTGEVPGTF